MSFARGRDGGDTTAAAAELARDDGQGADGCADARIDPGGGDAGPRASPAGGGPAEGGRAAGGAGGTGRAKLMLVGRPCCVKNAWWPVKRRGCRAWKKDVQTAPWIRHTDNRVADRKPLACGVCACVLCMCACVCVCVCVCSSPRLKTASLRLPQHRQPQSAENHQPRHEEESSDVPKPANPPSGAPAPCPPNWNAEPSSATCGWMPCTSSSSNPK